MEINGEIKEGYKLSTIKLRGQISQGLVLSIKDMMSLLLVNNDFLEIRDCLENEGQDLTECLNIHKYEAIIPTSLRGEVKGPFPSFINVSPLSKLSTIPMDVSTGTEVLLFQPQVYATILFPSL